MSNPKSYLAYPEVKAHLDAAMTLKSRVITFDTSKAAVKFVSLCNSYRVLDRKENKVLFPEGHTMHGRSDYDVLYITRKGAEVTIGRLYVETVSVVDEEWPRVEAPDMADMVPTAENSLQANDKSIDNPPDPWDD